MLGWLDEVAGPGYSQAVLWTVLVLLLLVVLLVIVKVVRNMMFGTFVSGGRNRKTRLAVMDATAVDSHRRLVLVRRDDVEHLILIGGTADIVVERDIRISNRRAVQPGEPAPAPHVAPVAAEQAPAAAPAPSAPPRQVPETPINLPRPPALKPVAPVPAAPRAPETLIARATPRPELQRPAPPPLAAPAPRPAPRPEPFAPPVSSAKVPPPAPSSEDLDDALLKELEVSLDDGDAVPPKVPSPTLDDEMAKLLGELSKPRR
jgi:hypothetical protein